MFNWLVSFDIYSSDVYSYLMNSVFFIRSGISPHTDRIDYDGTYPLIFFQYFGLLVGEDFSISIIVGSCLGIEYINGVY